MAAALAVAAAGTGCGEASPEENAQDAREAAERYVSALREGDAEGACELLTKGAVKQLESESSANCAKALGEVFGLAGEGGEDLADLRVTEVNVAGRVATAKIVSGPGGEATTQLMREQGEWRVATPGG